MDNSFKIKDRIKSFKYGLDGIVTMMRSQHNAWIHAAATILVVIAGLYFGFSKAEWCWIVLAIMAVWTTEAFNTALEFFMDVISPEFHPLIGMAKDVAAGAVLITAIGSAIIGLLIIGPYLLNIILK